MEQLDKKWLPLLDAVIEQHKLDLTISCHGPRHWFRVIDNGLRLCKKHKDVNPDIIIAFGLLHDSARTHDGHCEVHGTDAIGVARDLRELIPLNDRDFLSLCVACGNHTRAHPNPKKNRIKTEILICWDADRLDLERVGITPDNRYLFTDAAKKPGIQEWSNENAYNDLLPEWAKDIPWRKA